VQLGSHQKNWARPKKTVWYELLEVLPDGVVTSECRYPLAYVTTLIVKQLRGDLAAWEAGQLRSYFAGFGMTPADRVKVHVHPRSPKMSGTNWMRLPSSHGFAVHNVAMEFLSFVSFTITDPAHIRWWVLWWCSTGRGVGLDHQTHAPVPALRGHWADLGKHVEH
jgi:hypothetical protein